MCQDNPTPYAILSVEDDSNLQDLYEQILQDRIGILSAFTVEEGLQLFCEHPEIVIVVMDGNVPCQTMTTVGLTKEIRRRGFTGPMIASSSDTVLSSALMKAGCDYQSQKFEVPDLIIRLLRSP